MPTLQEHLTPMLARYLAEAGAGRFDQVQHEIRAHAWRGHEVRPLPSPTVAKDLDRLFEALQRAAEHHDRNATVSALADLRATLHRMDPAT